MTAGCPMWDRRVVLLLAPPDRIIAADTLLTRWGYIGSYAEVVEFGENKRRTIVCFASKKTPRTTWRDGA